MEMGEKIYNLRIEKGLTLEELGNMVGVGKSTVRKWEKGMISNMKRDKIAKLASALGTTPAYLMGWEEEYEPSQSEEAYYLDDDAREMAQFLFENPEYKVLFDASRKVSKEDIATVKAIMDRFGSN